MEIQLLGGLSAQLPDRKLHLGTPKQQAVFAMLAVHAGQLVSLNDLVDELWSDDPPRSAIANVRTYAANLRRTFEASDTGPSIIVRQQNGYRLTVGPELIDVFRFEMERAAGREAVMTGDLDRALELLATAVARWRGPIFAGIPLGPVLTARAVAAEEERLLAVELLADVQLRSGRDDLAIPLLRELIVRHPLREPAYALLLRGLYERGDHAGALVAYDELRTRLTSELGTVPGASLQSLHMAIKAGPARAPRPTGRSAGAVSSVAASQGAVDAERRRQPHQVDHLPRAVTDFVGREDVVSRLLSETRRVEERVPAVHIIDGMAGSGKTTLAVHLARRLSAGYPDAALFIDLCGHGEKNQVEPASALVTLLRQLEVPAERIPIEFDDRRELWRRELALRRSVIVLDNAAGSEQIMPLLPVEPTAVVLVTSRRRLAHLGVGPSQTLPALTEQESLDLLALTLGRDRVTAEPDAAATLVRLCGHLPLAIRLAGARLAHRRGWQVADLVDQLAGATSALHQLAGEQSTVRGAFATSYEPLPEPTRRVFRFLGLYPGRRFGPPSVAALTGLSVPEARGALDDLVDRNLVEDVDSTRYQLHDLMRQYSAELCSRTDPVDDRRRALAQLFDFTVAAALTAAETVEPGVLRFNLDPAPTWRPELVDAIGELTADWLEAERTDLVTIVVSALDHGFHEHSWRLARALWRFCYIRGYFEDIILTHRHALVAAETTGDVAATALMNNYLASGYVRTGDNRNALSHLTRAVALSRESRDSLNTARYRANLAAVYWWNGNLTAAVDVSRESLRDYKGYGNVEVPMALPNLGIALISLGRYEEALRLHRLHLFWARTHSDDFHILNALSHIGAVRVRMGALPQAIRILLASLALRDRTGHRYAEGEVRNDLGIAYRGLGRLVEAQQEHETARKLSVASGERHVEAAALNELGRTLLAQGRGGEAYEMFQEALRLATRIAHPHEQGRALSGLAEHFARVDPVEARRHWERALAIFRRMGVPERFEVERRLAELPDRAAYVGR
ncbi:BTAD domain-containing putative transcriptional regulator [Micromonospora sp. WMMD1120]|uniref:AfsR/SARP family transcriptional regulator n=1 Tax=Micromonospora sp. WMMD1120 TaxID=3016106 RepID=UPI002417DE97|nr:BTAD domain-containing putative transcriptional regulator [Micromonospora sp. WMMD1120]MDG4806879.1 BTAD domain-containing putative transcriptional regulator [Micromonospora sp. WMMD1120]